MSILDEGIKSQPAFGPRAQTRQEMMGIRYMTDAANPTGDGAQVTPAAGAAAPATPAAPAAVATPQPAQAPAAPQAVATDEPQADAAGKIDMQEFLSWKKARNAENQSLRARLRDLEMQQLTVETGLSKEQLSALNGTTPEELRVSAKLFADAVKAATAAAAGTTEPGAQAPAQATPAAPAAPAAGTQLEIPSAGVQADPSADTIVANKDYAAVAKALGY